jgi:hypothetical protein
MLRKCDDGCHGTLVYPRSEQDKLEIMNKILQIDFPEMDTDFMPAGAGAQNEGSGH